MALDVFKRLRAFFFSTGAFGVLPAVLALGYFIPVFAMQATTWQAGSWLLPLCLPSSPVCSYYWHLGKGLIRNLLFMPFWCLSGWYWSTSAKVCAPLPSPILIAHRWQKCCFTVPYLR